MNWLRAGTATLRVVQSGIAAVIDRAQTISGQWTFDRGTDAPFGVVSGAAVVANLDADLLDGNEASSFATAAQGALADSAVQEGDSPSFVGLEIENGSFSPLYVTRSTASAFSQAFASRKGRAGSGVVNGDQLARFMAFGELDTGSYAAASANQDVFGVLAAETFTASAQGRSTKFYVVRSGTVSAVAALELAADGSVNVSNGNLDVNGNKVRLRTSKTPSSASDTGNAGDICWDSNYIYVCTATNTWTRTALSTW